MSGRQRLCKGRGRTIEMELFASRLVVRGGEQFGEVTHPETNETYHTRFQQKDKDRWQLDGCTAAKVCLTAPGYRRWDRWLFCSRALHRCEC